MELKFLLISWNDLDSVYSQLRYATDQVHWWQCGRMPNLQSRVKISSTATVYQSQLSVSSLRGRLMSSKQISK